VLAGIEHVIGTAFDDILIGSDGRETLEGGAGDDRLAAQNGDDLLLGGDGDDLLARGLLADRQAPNITGNKFYDGGDGTDIVAFEVNSPVYFGTVGGTARYRTIESRFLQSDLVGTQDRSVTFSWVVRDTPSLTARLGEDGADGLAQIIAPELRSQISLTGLSGSGRFDYTYSGFAGFETGWTAGSAPVSATYSGYTRAAIIGVDIPLPRGSLSQNQYLDLHNGDRNIIKSSYFGEVVGVNQVTSLRSAASVLSSDTLRGVEGIIGTDNDDRIFGNAEANALFGNGGDDYIEGGAGDDRLGFGKGESLSNEFSFPQAPSFPGGGFLGPTGVQSMLNQLRTLDPDATTTSAAPRVNVGQVKIGSSSAITDFGSFLWGGAGSDTLDLRFDRGIGFYPGQGPTARAFVDLDVLPTNTVISTVTGQRVVYGEASWLNGLGQVFQKATLFGIENVIGSANSDTLLGDARDNVLEGMAGADLLDGREGNDTLSYALAPSGVTLNFRAEAGRLIMDNTQPFQTGAGHAQGDLARNFETIRGSDHADIVLFAPAAVAPADEIAFVPVLVRDLVDGAPVGEARVNEFQTTVALRALAAMDTEVASAFELGAGDDHVTFLGSTGLRGDATLRTTINLGDGDDTARIGGLGLTLDPGAGDDVITLVATPAGSYAGWSEAQRTTRIEDTDPDGIDTVILEGDGLHQVVLTATGARVLRFGDLSVLPREVTPEALIAAAGPPVSSRRWTRRRSR
jgi:Ca2+-binding RTX toxin-like protein